MKQKYTFIALLFITILFNNVMNSQVLFTDNFSYPVGNLVPNGGWAVTGTATTTPIQIIASGLTYTGYIGSGIGGAVQFGTSGEDDNHPLTDSVNSGSVYCSALVNCSAAQTGDYFIHFGDGGSFNFVARTEIRVSATNGFDFGIIKNSTGGVLQWTNQPLAFNQTYLIVLKYTYKTGSVTDDQADLFVNPNLGASEPAPTLSTAAGNDMGATGSAIKTINFRQGGGTAAPTVQVDGIRIGRTWNDLGGSVPVELTSFTAVPANGAINLSWKTSTEVNNRGFYVERSSDKTDWTSLTFVQGHQNSTSINTYSYVDRSVTQSGKYYYRLKQIDNDGSFKYSPVAEGDFSSPSVFSLNQNYPNPFNPSTSITYSLPEASNVKLIVYNAIGQPVKVLENGFKNAGTYKILFNAIELSSGIYFYKMEAGQFSQIRKMMLVK
jgi:hypothetical protein